MMLTLETSKVEKAFIKKFQNGIGIRSLNQLTGREKTVIIRAENRTAKSIAKENQFYKKNNLTNKNQSMASKISTEKIMANIIDQCRGSNKTSNISGLHVFWEDDAPSSLNIQKRSVIFVANKDIARQNGVHFTIPGTLMNIIYVNAQENKRELEFTAETIIKPITLVVGEYTLHIDISCKFSPDNITYKTIATQTTTETVNLPTEKCYSQNTVSMSDSCSIISELDITQPNTVNISSRAELHLFDDTPQSFRKEISVEGLTDGEFARLFNPMSSTKKSQSITTPEDIIENAFPNYRYSSGLKFEEHKDMVNQTESKSEHSITTFDSHIGFGTHNNTEHSISRSLQSCENVFANSDINLARSYNTLLHEDTNNYFKNNEISMSEEQFSALSPFQCTQKSVSNTSCLKKREGTITNQNYSSKTIKCKEQEINMIGHRSSIDISIHEIKQQLSNVASSLNEINSFVQIIDKMSQKSSREKDKLNRSINDISKIENNNQCRPMLSNLHDRKDFSPTHSQSVCGHCGSFYSNVRSGHHQIDQFREVKYDHYNAKDVECSKNQLNNYKINHTHTSIQNNYSIHSNEGRKTWKSESSASFNVEYSDLEANNTGSRQEFHGLKSRTKPNSYKSTEIIHCNDNYQDCLSTSTTITRKQQNKNHNARTTIKLANSKKLFLQNDGINTFDDIKSMTKGVESRSTELISIHKQSSSKYNNVDSLIKLKNKHKLAKWSRNLRKIFRNREKLQFNIFSLKSPMHNLKQPTQQNSECSQNTEVLRFQRITDWVTTQFHKKSDPCLSAKTLHIVPSRSQSKSTQQPNESFESVINIDRPNSAHSADKLHQDKNQRRKTGPCVKN